MVSIRDVQITNRSVRKGSSKCNLHMITLSNSCKDANIAKVYTYMMARRLLLQLVVCITPGAMSYSKNFQANRYAEAETLYKNRITQQQHVEQENDYLLPGMAR